MRKRLLRRGMGLSSGMLAVGFANATARAALPAGLVRNTVRAAAAWLGASGAVTSLVSTNVVNLSQAAVQIMWPARLRLMTVALVLIAGVGSGAGILALREMGAAEASASKNEENAPQAVGELGTPQSQAQTIEKKPERPQIVEVHPADGAMDVAPITEIRLRFDRPMARGNAFLVWDRQADAGFRSRGQMRYSEDKREFILPVELTPGRKHKIVMNGYEFPGPEKNGLDGFRSKEGVAAEAYHWSFTTKKAAAASGRVPRVISVSPTPDAEVSLFVPLEVTFDQPMDPLSYGLGVPEGDAQVTIDSGPSLLPRLISHADYKSEQHRFKLLVLFPPNWNGELRLDGFRSKEGVPASPVTLAYRTRHTVLSKALQQQVEQAGRSAELRQVIERICKARRKLRSVSEDVINTLGFSPTAAGWHQMLQMRSSRFQMETSGKFLAVIDNIMQVPFRIGSDGRTCWFRFKDQRSSLPADQIEKRLRFCDPFDALTASDTDRVIRQLKLEYLGERMLRGRHCYFVRSWARPNFLAWYIDTATLLPLRVEIAQPGPATTDFDCTRVNQPIPIDEFQPPSSGTVRVVPPDPLTKEYTHRFLRISDGSDGRMSVRWGRKGPKGANSSGLN